MNNKKMILMLSIFLVLILSGLLQLNKMEIEHDEKTIPTTESFGTPKKSKSWDLETIYINDNWFQINQTNDWCSGSGTWNDPYIIENVTLSSFNPNYIRIENTDEHFILNNCTLLTLGIGMWTLDGIYLNNVTNGIIENCKLAYNRNSIKLNNSHNITIRDNQIYYHLLTGINLEYSNNNTIIENDESIVGYEGISQIGIFLNRSNDNNITHNRIEDNYYGIILDHSNYTEVSYNVLRGNDYCIEEFTSHDNDIKYNDVDCIHPRKFSASSDSDDDKDIEKWDLLEESQKYLINPITLLFVYPIFGSLSVIVILQVRGFYLKKRKK